MMRPQQLPQQQQQDQLTRMFYDLSSIVLNMLRSPPSPEQFPDQLRLPEQITPSGFASLMVGVSLALMLSGSVTFFIGFMLMPWVIGLAMLFYVVGIVSSVSVLGRSIFGSPGKYGSAWNF